MARGATALLGILCLSVAAAGACSEAERELGRISQTCNVQGQCQEGLICDEALENICTKECASDADCDAEFGVAKCLTVPNFTRSTEGETPPPTLQRCVIVCNTTADCVQGGRCKVPSGAPEPAPGAEPMYWCGRTTTVGGSGGAGSGGTSAMGGSGGDSAMGGAGGEATMGGAAGDLSMGGSDATSDAGPASGGADG